MCSKSVFSTFFDLFPHPETSNMITVISHIIINFKILFIIFSLFEKYKFSIAKIYLIKIIIFINTKIYYSAIVNILNAFFTNSSSLPIAPMVAVYFP